MLKHSSKNLNLDGMLSTYAQKHICKSTPSKLGFMYVFIFLVKVTVWPPIGKIAAYEMFSWYKYLIVSLIFPTSVF